MAAKVGVEMAIGLRIKFAHGTKQQYDATHAAMHVDTDPPEGMIFHSAGPIDGGWGVIDVWESRAAFDQFIESRFRPSIQQLGAQTFSDPPEIKEFPVHNFTKP
jgi:hypothetical protein